MENPYQVNELRYIVGWASQPTTTPIGVACISFRLPENHFCRYGGLETHPTIVPLRWARMPTL
ncbi:MAG: hypothetical protein IKI11_10610 [Neisseriaceae bacterium]|nr:hypothetical protein [Neisseriaceae bacterium]